MLATARRQRLARSLAAAAALGGALALADRANANVYSRSARVFSTGASAVLDYRRNLKGTARDDPEYRGKLQALNQRIAERLLHLCFQNGGIYTKFGQQLATFNHGLPKEYTQTLAKLQDQAKPVPFDAAKQTIEAEMGRPWHELFQEFDREPIASASLAQVHHAVDRSGREVAVKVQYPHLASQMRADLVVMKAAFQLTEYFFPDIQIQWMFPEFECALTAELDFGIEKSNNRRIAACLRDNPTVHVPVVYDELSSRRMLTMEFIHAPKISQVDAIKSLGLGPERVAHILCEVFSEMIFCHGFVHCDPHAGNIFVRANPDPNAAVKEQLVLLDHGLYRELDEEFRKNHCDLWRAMLMRDKKLLQECGEKLKIGDLVQFLPLIFTYRPIDHKRALEDSMTKEEKEKLREHLQNVRVADVWDFMEQLPRDMLFVFRTNNMIRALNKDLGGSTRDRFSIMGKYAAQGHTTFYSGAAGSDQLSTWGRVKYWWDHSNLVFRLRFIDYAMSFLQYWRGGLGEERLEIKHSG